MVSIDPRYVRVLLAAFTDWYRLDGPSLPRGSILYRGEKGCSDGDTLAWPGIDQAAAPRADSEELQRLSSRHMSAMDLGGNSRWPLECWG